MEGALLTLALASRAKQDLIARRGDGDLDRLLVIVFAANSAHFLQRANRDDDALVGRGRRAQRCAPQRKPIAIDGGQCQAIAFKAGQDGWYLWRRLPRTQPGQ